MLCRVLECSFKQWKLQPQLNCEIAVFPYSPSFEGNGPFTWTGGSGVVILWVHCSSHFQYCTARIDLWEHKRSCCSSRSFLSKRALNAGWNKLQWYLDLRATWIVSISQCEQRFPGNLFAPTVHPFNCMIIGLLIPQNPVTWQWDQQGKATNRNKKLGLMGRAPVYVFHKLRKALWSVLSLILVASQSTNNRWYYR